MPNTTIKPTGECDVIVTRTQGTGVTVRMKATDIAKSFNVTFKSPDAMHRAEIVLAHAKAKKLMNVTFVSGGSSVNQVTEVILL